MSHKGQKKQAKTSTTDKLSTTYTDFDENSLNSNHICLSLILKGSPGPGDWPFLIMFNSKIIMETKWQHLLDIPQLTIPLNLNEAWYQSLIADRPLIFILRTASTKGPKDPDPLSNIDNKAGCTVDLFPLILGENEINLKVSLLSIQTGSKINCQVIINAKFIESVNTYVEKTPLIITMISAHCLPPAKDGTVYLCAMDLNSIHTPPVANFGMSLSDSRAKLVLWASASNGGHIATSNYGVPNEDKFIPSDLDLKDNMNCLSVYWNAMRRVLVDSTSLRDRLTTPFFVEVAGVPRQGKIDIRGRYMAFVDAGVLLEAAQFGVTVCAKLLPYNETNIPENFGTLLELPPASTKTSAREPNLYVTDEYGHFPYIVMRFDLCETLTPKKRLASYFEILGLSPPKRALLPVFELDYMEKPVENISFDAKSIKKGAEALLVHEELNQMAYRGPGQMNLGLKRIAANNLALSVRSMIKKFGIEKCDDWQNIVTAQHRASVRSVLASFSPQVPSPALTSRTAATRSRLVGDIRIANEHDRNNLNASPGHPRILLTKILRSLESRNESEARKYLLESLSSQPNNRFLLWILGGIDFDKYDLSDIANAALRIAAKGDVSDGITGAIGWAALHAFNHFRGEPYVQFTAAKRMRKYFELDKTWKKFIEQWVEDSGEEEILWDPKNISAKDPLLIAAAFFLCLRCFKFSERIVQCLVNGCSTRGSNFVTKNEIASDIWYLKAASHLIRNQVKEALQFTDQAIAKFGPSSVMCQMRAICLIKLKGWGKECEEAIIESDLAGAKPCSFVLYNAALAKFRTEPEAALQYAARAHKNTPSAFTALLIGRIFAKLNEEYLAERWAAAAVNTEPLLADGWAFLAILAIQERNIIKAKAMLRTSRQVGPLSLDINKELKKLLKADNIETLPDTLTKNVCFCDYY